MIVHLDTSALVDALTGPRRAFSDLERTAVSTLVLYEWLRGPRTAEELADQEARVFGRAEAVRAADLYRTVKRPRGRDLDIAIFACALEQGARLWTLNPEDFRDMSGLLLYDPGR
jgi:predicted nucleic acid-binding protein